MKPATLATIAMRKPLDGDSPGGELAAAGGRLREEWRAEEEEYTRAAAAQWAHGRRLPDIARELMHRGDTVALTVGEARFTGAVALVGIDFLELRGPAGRVDVHLAMVTGGAGGREIRVPAPIVLRVIERARAGGRGPGDTAITFRARLLEYEQDDVVVELGSWLLREQLRGRLRLGRDVVHLRDRDERETYLPLAWVSWARAASAIPEDEFPPRR